MQFYIRLIVVNIIAKKRKIFNVVCKLSEFVRVCEKKNAHMSLYLSFKDDIRNLQIDIDSINIEQMYSFRAFPQNITVVIVLLYKMLYNSGIYRAVKNML